MRDCNTEVSRRGALDSGCQVADRLNGSTGREEHNVVLALVVSFQVIMINESGQDASQRGFAEQD
jgi:hypothetical protein